MKVKAVKAAGQTFAADDEESSAALDPTLVDLEDLGELVFGRELRAKPVSLHSSLAILASAIVREFHPVFSMNVFSKTSQRRSAAIGG